MSIFEITMLICFGTAWPFSIARSWKSRSSVGKSVIFLWIILLGYAAGITHKILHSRDGVICFYAMNAILVSIDIALYYRNRCLDLRRHSVSRPAHQSGALAS